MFVGVPARIEGSLGIWEPRNHTTLRWDSVLMKGHPETQEPRYHTALRGSLLSRGVADLREAIPDCTEWYSVMAPFHLSSSIVALVGGCPQVH